ncbi:phosphomannomutase [Aeromicrobium sp. PE09-221]|uniref:phospho-sugar mutase n=1 Tax=Aeromicrobium sp. PE09-221 TaxID=1898043 RepID=UPI000B3EDC53|nr:phospho-sugar mutase [Aeromicrobium sp. PE09-221]OUZ08289.1 phosphomannomutase [Aeromicrobium sp. PE09-221]
MTGPEAIDLARAWIAQDPDDETRAELQRLVERREHAVLARRFAGRLTFGTAGLRGELGAGPTRMNRVVVAQAARGLADYLRSRHEHPTVVIGYDAREKSDRFARDTAEILRGAGIGAVLFSAPTPTPVLAFAIRHLGCVAGVMVTASHNPPRDNGYKVYLGDSSQIVPPADTEIAEAISAVGPIDTLPRGDDYQLVGEDVIEAYLDVAVALVGEPPAVPLDVVYTPLHGVGLDIMSEAARRAGFAPLHVVADQAEPDPRFPTVAFPNPEEPGAMDLALAQAREIGADLVIANDPDADRCAVAVPVGDDYRMLSGDELGALLADQLLACGIEGTYASSIVSSDLLGRQAVAYGQPWRQTLTGFKWIGKVDGLAFGYEEALGYCVAPAIARDKDGITAALAVLRLATRLKQRGAGLMDRLHEIYAEHGWHATGQVALRVDDLSMITETMDRLRTSPPTELGGRAVTRVDDLAAGYAGLPPTDGIRLQLGDNARVIVRPSGTEPKVKCYLEVVIPVGDDLADAERRATEELERLRTDVTELLS